ncbi:MAG: nickel pincer cofactor biosynthesis protein LarB [Phycisphaerae bacterium]
MQPDAVKQLLRQVKDGTLDIDTALEKMRLLPFEANEFVSVDHHRAIRCGFGEVIFSQGKTPIQVREIFKRLAEQNPAVLATRADRDHFREVVQALPRAEYNELARTITWRAGEKPEPVGHIAVVSAGTSDMPVAEEARVTAELFDQHVTAHYDVGVAGLHRLLAHGASLQGANALVVVAGMEGALASVVGGLVAAPVIAVPTSVGYGASFGGLSALLTMLNSCATGVSVVNIDNGFAAGYIASQINRQSARAGR